MKQIERDILRDNPEVIFLTGLRNAALKQHDKTLAHSAGKTLANKVGLSATHVQHAQPDAQRDASNERAKMAVAYIKGGRQ